jgi:hypothetical protein
MQRAQESIISGNIYDYYYDTNQDITLGSRIPYLGQKVSFRDGREYVFCSTLVDLPAGTLVGSVEASAEGANIFNNDDVAGTTEVQITLASITADQYAGGFLNILTGNAAGAYSILSNTASAATTNYVTLTLGEPLRGTLASASDDLILVPNRYKNIVVNTADNKVVGVVPVATAVATDADATTCYQWIQTKGVGAALIGTETNANAGVAAMAGAGVVEIADGTKEVVGVFLNDADVSDTDLAPIELCVV